MDYEKKEGRYPEDLLIRARDEVSKMSISDNAFFVNIMKDPKVFKHIIRLVLGEEMEIVGEIEEVHTEYTYTVPGFKGVRLDAVARDSNGDLCHIELENSLERATIERARVYRAISDAHSLRPGDSYEDIKRGISIFLVAGDVFGRGEVKYSFEYMERRLGFSAKAGSHILFVNINADVEGELGAMLRGLREPNAQKIDDIILSSAVSYIKGDDYFMVQIYDTKIRLSAEREKEISQISYEKGMADGLRDGETIGRSLAMKEMVLNGHKQGLSSDSLASITGLTSEEVDAIINSN